jgi:hypothetical protein
MNQLQHDKELIDEMNRYYEARAKRHDDFMSYTSKLTDNDNVSLVLADAYDARCPCPVRQRYHLLRLSGADALDGGLFNFLAQL